MKNQWISLYSLLYLPFTQSLHEHYIDRPGPIPDLRYCNNQRVPVKDLPMYYCALTAPAKKGKFPNVLCDDHRKKVDFEFYGNRICSRGISNSADIARIVQYHNFHRSRVAKGEEDLGNPGPQEQASNMIKVHWNDLLAIAAQRSLDTAMDMNTVNNVVDGYSRAPFGVTSNHIWLRNSTRTRNYSEFVNYWYNPGVSMMNITLLNLRYQSKDKYLRNYRNMMMAGVMQLGCGYISYYSKKTPIGDTISETPFYQQRFRCNYGVKLDIGGGNLYSRGLTCEDCPGFAQRCGAGGGMSDGLCIVTNESEVIRAAYENPVHIQRRDFGPVRRSLGGEEGRKDKRPQVISGTTSATAAVFRWVVLEAIYCIMM